MGRSGVKTKTSRKVTSARRAKRKAQQQPVSRKPKKIPVEQLVLEHRENGRKLARSMLRRWRVRMLAEEIDSLVDLTLCEAGARFEPTKGASFITFFFYHLRGHLVRAVTSATQASQVFLSYSQYTGIDGGDFLPVADDGVREQVAATYAALERDHQSPEDLLIRKENRQVCSKACEVLDDLEKEVVNRSFADEESLVDIAKDLGYSRCHISRVKRRALERVRDQFIAIGEDVPPLAPTDSETAQRPEVQRHGAQKKIRRRPTRTIGARLLNEMLRKRA